MQPQFQQMPAQTATQTHRKAEYSSEQTPTMLSKVSTCQQIQSLFAAVRCPTLHPLQTRFALIPIPASLLHRRIPHPYYHRSSSHHLIPQKQPNPPRIHPPNLQNPAHLPFVSHSVSFSLSDFPADLSAYSALDFLLQIVWKTPFPMLSLQYHSLATIIAPLSKSQTKTLGVSLNLRCQSFVVAKLPINRFVVLHLMNHKPTMHCSRLFDFQQKPKRSSNSEKSYFCTHCSRVLALDSP
mmetsp:Transcript_4960/g.8618  ORF Transcript_4960/g.8618 Transcript_4960/m.8618 type:complete len:239 (+) Transcript_4960:3376-4092(+)